MNYEAIDIGNDFLAHHGILGQKWGKLNGPPYPLGSNDHTRKQQSLARKAGIKVGGDSGLGEHGGAVQLKNESMRMKRSHAKSNPSTVKEKPNSKSGRKQMDPRLKKALIIGGVTTAALVAAYAAYRIPKVKKMHENIDPATGLRLKDHYMSAGEDLAAVNAGRRGGMFDKSGGYSRNCYLCTTDYELRRRGYDVKARMAWGKDLNYADKIFKNPEHHTKYNDLLHRTVENYTGINTFFETNRVNSIKEFESYASNMGPNARGNLCVLWDSFGAHSIIWENDSAGKLHLLDGQTYHEYKDFAHDFILSHAIPIDYFRTDNLELNDINELHNAVEDSLSLSSGLSERAAATVAAGTSAIAGIISGMATYYSIPDQRKGKPNANRRRIQGTYK